MGIKVCSGRACTAKGSDSIKEIVVQEFPNNQLDSCKCTGNCHLAPNLFVNDNLVCQVTRENVVEEINRALIENTPNHQNTVEEKDIDDIFKKDLLNDLI
jgi:NADH:ubiquinone oxidoreductase subunit E